MKRKLIIALLFLVGLSGATMAQWTSTSSQSSSSHRTTSDGAVIDEFEKLNIKKREVLLFPGLHIGLGLQGGITTYDFNQQLGRLPFSNRDLPSDPNFGSRFDYSYGLNVAIDYYFNKYVGIHTGIDLYRFQAGYRLQNAMSEQEALLPIGNGLVDNKETTLHSYTELVNESYRSHFIEIPVGLAVRTKYFNMNFGVKLGYNFGSQTTYEYGTTTIYTADFLAGTGTQLHDEAYYDEYEGATGSFGSGYIFNRFHILGNIEIDYRIIDKYENVWLVGLFADYSLMSRNINPNNENFFTYMSPELASDGSTQWVEVNQYSDAVVSNFTETFRPVQFGVKIQFHLPLNPAYKEAYKQ